MKHSIANPGIPRCAKQNCGHAPSLDRTAWTQAKTGAGVMRNFLFLASASALLSASVFAAVASADVSHRAKAAAAAIPEAAKVRLADTCAPAAWPYGRPACAPGRSDEAPGIPVRQVRFIEMVQR